MLKNITLSAEETLIHQARERAHSEHTTLNDTFRQWLTQYVRTGWTVDEYDQLMASFDYANPGRPFTRDEMNER